jgi:hypothetical protein
MISDKPLAPAGGADSKVMAYNYRLCLTNASAPSSRVAIDKPAGYDPDFFEAPRRYMRANPPHTLSKEVLKIYDVASSGDGVS